MQEPPSLQTGPEQPNPEPMSLTARLFNVFATPGEVFEYLARSGPSPGNWLAPALLISILGIILSWVVLSQPAIQHQIQEITSYAIEQQITKSKMPPSQAEQARAMGEKYGSIGTKVTMYAAPVFLAFFMPFFWGLLMWAVGRLAFKAQFTYMKAVEAAGLAAMITLLDTVLKSLLIMATGNLFASVSPALLILDKFDPQNPTHSLLAAVNLMAFWVLALRALGLAKLAGTAYWKAAAWVFGLWGAWAAAMLGLSMLGRALAG